MGKIGLDNVKLDYNDNGTVYNALDGLTFDVKEGEFVSLIGSSGCGKSTALSVLSGLRNPDSGTLLIDGQPTTGTGKNRGVVFQHYSLFPWMTVIKNVEYGIRQVFPEIPKKDRLNEAKKYLEKVGLAEFINKYPFQLSGGMQQRAAIARTLAMKPEILLMDEPFGAIDAKNRVVLQDLLLHILEESDEKKTVIFVTHDVDEAILLSDRILFMDQKKISKEIAVNFPRPRNREELIDREAYRTLRKRVVNLFYYESDEKSEVEGGEGI